MKMNLTLLLISLISFATVSSKPQGNGDYHIVNGRKVLDIKKYSHHASIKKLKDGINICGATIISSNHLVTAAHCFCVPGGHKIADLYIYVGSVYLDHGGLNYEIQEGICYPDFNTVQMSGDIALIKIKECFDEKVVKPISLVSNEVHPNTTVIIIGWGAIEAETIQDPITDEFSVTKKHTNQLMKAFVTVIDVGKCREQYTHYKKQINEKQICTHVSGKRGICFGDSGGPLLHFGRLAGITSYTIPCSQEYPDVFTRVGSYIKWIQEHVDVDVFEEEEYTYSDYDDVNNEQLQILNI